MTLQERLDNIKKEYEGAVLKFNQFKDLMAQGETRIHQLQGQYQIIEELLKTEVQENTNVVSN